MRIRPEFLRSLGRTVDLARLEESHHTIYGLTAELRLAYFNPAWLEFAAMNGAPRLGRDWPLGHPVIAAVPEPLRPFYMDGYAGALATGEPWVTSYEAPTPHRRRLWQMRVEPLAGGLGLIVTNLPLVDQPHAEAGMAADDKRYRDAAGRLHQCPSCRAFSPVAEPRRWDLVPSWLALPPSRVAAQLCPECQARHYPDLLAA